MAPRKLKTQTVDSSKAVICYQRGRELLESAIEAAAQERWAAVGVVTVHAAISLADGLLIQERGLRAIGSSHMELVDVMGLELGNLPGVKEAQKHLRHVISEKNRVEYEARVLTKADALALMQHLQRFADWVNRHRRGG